MKIVYFYQYFSTPKGAWGTRVYDFCKDWVAQGHEVTVVTSIYSKSDLKAERFIEDQYFDGIHVKVLNIRIDNKHSILRRIWTFVLYAIFSSWFAITLRADVVIASSGPITVGIPGLIARWIRRRKLIFETRVLWPEGAIELGIIRNKTLIKLTYFLEEVCYKSAHHIVCLSPGMVENILARHPLLELTSITNAADLDLFDGKSCDLEVPKCLRDKKVGIYTGNVGKTNNVELLVRAAELLKKYERHDILIVIIGDGPLKARLVEEKSRKNLNNLITNEI
jgi:glycosyltransferase involved in cell wall biosynthesis